MSKAFITDYIDNPDLESAILGDLLSDKLHNDIQALLVWHEHIDKNYIDQLPNLKGIVRYGVGFDSIDLSYAKSKGIFVCNTPDYGTNEVSDTTIAMILNITRGITRYDYLCRTFKDDWQENTITSIKRTSDIKLGVIGAGRIGGSVILKANQIGYQTYFYDPYVSRGHEKLLNSNRIDSLNDLLANCDVISIHCPLSEETMGLINEDFISKIKKGASLVNTARGKIIKDIDIFYDPLKTGHLSNLALDVIPEEPPQDSQLINAWKNKEPWLDGRFILNPHTAYYSSKAFIEMREKAAKNVLRILNGETPFNIVNM